MGNVPILCYDSRYAESAPVLSDCASIIANQIVIPRYGTRTVYFSRNPVGEQFRVPKCWTTPRDNCRITIDIPPTAPAKPFDVEEATMLQIKTAALEVLRECVARGDHLGGIAAVGRHWHLQVRVEGSEKEPSWAVDLRKDDTAAL
ncbi:MAG: hypothetical protein Q9173_001583 [Seirophora scorigena]